MKSRSWKIERTEKRLGDLEVTSKGLVQALRPENRGAQVSQGEGR